MAKMEKKPEWRLVKTDEEEFVVPWNDEAKAKYFLDEAKKAESENDIFGCKSWLLTGVSIVPNSFELHFEAYSFEKRRQNIPEIAWHFESLYRKFPNDMEKEIEAMADAVRNLHMTRVKETEEQAFLNKIFISLSRTFQMEVLLTRTEKTPAHYEKCQIMLLLVKLFPDTVNQHGADLLFTVLGYDSDVNSIFRKLLVTELIPAVLHIGKEWSSNKISQIHQILNQCIEYYVLAPDAEESNNENDKWTKLFKLVDRMGKLLRWKISPFFNEYSGPSSIDGLFQKLSTVVTERKEWASNEIAYPAVVFFLHCVTSYNQLRNGPDGENSNMTLVEIFTPHKQRSNDSDLPILLTASHSSVITANQTHLIHFFLTATKIWQMFNSLKSQEGKEFFQILNTMKSLDLDNWNVFQVFSADYRTYVGQHFLPDTSVIQNPIQLASFHCALGNHKLAAEFAIKAANSLYVEEEEKGNNNESNKDSETKEEDFPSPGVNDPEDLSFFNPHLYTTDATGNFVPQRRVHFLSDSPGEVATYAANVLIKCFYESLTNESVQPSDQCLGHLITLIQLEWPSPPAEMIFLQIIEIIRKKGSLRYSQYFGDFIFEPDFLEQFMSMSNHEGKVVTLDIWPGTNGTPTGSSRRMATRGVDKGAKNDFRVHMKKQMMKQRETQLEKLILKFMYVHKKEILDCFNQEPAAKPKQ